MTIGARRYLALEYDLKANKPALVGTGTFIPPEAREMPGYELLASPTLYPGQSVLARAMADETNDRPVVLGLYLREYGSDDRLEIVPGPERKLDPGGALKLSWQIDASAGQPIAEIGVRLQCDSATHGKVYLDYLTWQGEPDVVWRKAAPGGTMWRRAWVDAVDHYFTHFEGLFRLAQDQGRGLLMQGTRRWKNVAVAATVTPFLARRFGLAVRVQGMTRYYALLVDGNGGIELVRVHNTETTLVKGKVDWDGESPLSLRLEVFGDELWGRVDGVRVLNAVDSGSKLKGGGIALIVEEGCINVNGVEVRPSQA